MAISIWQFDNLTDHSLWVVGVGTYFFSEYILNPLIWAYYAAWVTPGQGAVNTLLCACQCHGIPPRSHLSIVTTYRTDFSKSGKIWFNPGIQRISSRDDPSPGLCRSSWAMGGWSLTLASPTPGIRDSGLSLSGNKRLKPVISIEVSWKSLIVVVAVVLEMSSRQWGGYTILNLVHLGMVCPVWLLLAVIRLVIVIQRYWPTRTQYP